MTIIDTIRAAFPDAPHRDPKQLAPLTLAYVGDTVYDLCVRSYLVSRADATPHALHLAAARLVCAAGQARTAQRLTPLLTSEELAVFKRGRNAHAGTMPKNATVADYHAATGLEALMGYLYLSGNDARISELMQIGLTGEEHVG